MQQTLSAGLILEVGQPILAADGLESTVSIILDAVVRLAGAETAGLFQLGGDDQLLRCTHAAGRDAERMQRLVPLQVGEGVAGLAVAERRPSWTADILGDARIELADAKRLHVARSTFRSVMAAPLIVNGVARGALVGHGRETGRFAEPEVELLTALASLAGVALENARLHEEARAQAHCGRVVADMARIVSSTLDLPDMLRALMREIQRVVPCVLASFAFYDPGRNTITFHEMGVAEDTSPPMLTVPADQTLSWQVMQSRTPVIVDDNRDTAVPLHRLRVKNGLLSNICLPIIRDDECLGALNVVSDRPRAFTREHLAYLEELTPYLAVALENARLHEETRARAHRAQVVAEMARIISSTLDLPDLLRTLLPEIQRIVPCVAASFVFHDPVADTMTFLVMGAPDRPAQRSSATVPAANTVAERVMRTRRSEIVYDYRQSPIPLHGERVAEGFLSSAAIPILREHEALAVLNVVSDRARAFSAEHVAYLEELTPHLAVAIEKARLFEQVTTRARRNTRLAQLSRLVSESPDVEHVQQFVVQAAADLLDADLIRLYLVDGDGKKLHLAASTVSARVSDLTVTWSPAAELTVHGTLLGHIVSTGRSRFTRDIQTDPLTAHKARVRSLGFRSQLAAPLLAGSRAIGVLSVGYRAILEPSADDV